MLTITAADRLNLSSAVNFVVSVWILLAIVWFFKGSTYCTALDGSDVPIDSCHKRLEYVKPHEVKQSHPVDFKDYKQSAAYNGINWFPVVVIVLVVIPSLCWFVFLGGDKWYELATSVKSEGATQENGLMIFHWRRNKRYPSLPSLYLLVKLGHLGVFILVLYLMSLFLGGSFFWPFTQKTLFPSETTCYREYFSRIVYMGEKKREFTTCTHPMAGWYKFAFCIQWIWFVLAVLINILDLFSSFRYWNNPGEYESIIRKPLASEGVEVVDDFLKFLGEDRIFMFTLIYKNCESDVVDSLLRHVLNEYKLSQVSKSKTVEDAV